MHFPIPLETIVVVMVFAYAFGMTYDFIAVQTQAHITTITLNRPEVMNVINAQMHDELQSAFDAFAADDEQRVCVVTGAGERAFCAGSDLKSAMESGLASSYPKNGYAGLIERFDLNKPVIAAVNGICLGGGFEVALACDIIIASETATFGLPEPLVGAVALGGGLHRLARQIGTKHAMGLILTSRTVSAEEGRELGFINTVVPAADLEKETAKWCQQILRGAPLSVQASKATVNRGLQEGSLADAMKHQETYPEFKRWRGAEDTVEGIAAFVEKRKPEWKGR